MTRGWEDQLDRMMRDPFDSLPRSGKGRPAKKYRTASAEVDFSTPYEETAATTPRRPLGDILADVDAARADAGDGGWEKGQEHPCAAFPLVSVAGLGDTYRLSPTKQCQPISGDATLQRFGFLK